MKSYDFHVHSTYSDGDDDIVASDLCVRRCEQGDECQQGEGLFYHF